MQLFPSTLASIIVASRYELAKQDGERLAAVIPQHVVFSPTHIGVRPDEASEISFDAGVETPQHGDVEALE